MPTIKEAIETFKPKYNFEAITSILPDEQYGIIYVYTTDAKVWVDLPSHHEGYPVKISVSHWRNRK
jgi:hypothetical protein